MYAFIRIRYIWCIFITNDYMVSQQTCTKFKKKVVHTRRTNPGAQVRKGRSHQEHCASTHLLEIVAEISFQKDYSIYLLCDSWSGKTMVTNTSYIPQLNSRVLHMSRKVWELKNYRSCLIPRFWRNCFVRSVLCVQKAPVLLILSDLFIWRE